jgi:hypothetical protein
LEQANATISPLVHDLAEANAQIGSLKDEIAEATATLRMRLPKAVHLGKLNTELRCMANDVAIKIVALETGREE